MGIIRRSIVDCHYSKTETAGDFQDCKSSSRRLLWILDSRVFIPKSWMCKKQTSDSHSFIESEAVFFGRGSSYGRYLRTWSLRSIYRSITLFWKHSSIENPVARRNSKQTHQEVLQSRWSQSDQCRSRYHKRKNLFTSKSYFTFLKIMKQWSRWSLKSEVWRLLDWIFERINLHPKIQIKYTDVKNQLVRLVDERQFLPWWVEVSSPFVQHHHGFFDVLSAVICD